jgi:PLAC8 family
MLYLLYQFDSTFLAISMLVIMFVLFLPVVATGQVISRLKLQWNGKPGTVAQAAGAFPIIFGLVLFYWAVRLALSAAVIYIDPQRAFADPDDLESLPPPSASFITVMIMIDLWFYLSWVVMAVILYNVRKTTRQMYGIPVGCSGESEDCLVSTFCPCFAAGQLLRHTTQYEIYPATCCTERGIPPHAPSIV